MFLASLREWNKFFKWGVPVQKACCNRECTLSLSVIALIIPKCQEKKYISIFGEITDKQPHFLNQNKRALFIIYWFNFLFFYCKSLTSKHSEPIFLCHLLVNYYITPNFVTKQKMMRVCWRALPVSERWMIILSPCRPPISGELFTSQLRCESGAGKHIRLPNKMDEKKSNLFFFKYVETLFTLLSVGCRF